MMEPQRDEHTHVEIFLFQRTSLLEISNFNFCFYKSYLVPTRVQNSDTIDTIDNFLRNHAKETECILQGEEEGQGEADGSG